jgi:hypothetical protein
VVSVLQEWLLYSVLYHICHKVVSHYNTYDIAQNTGPIPVEQKQPNDKYDKAQNTGTIPVE